MAEVNIDIVGHDQASPVIKSVGDGFERLRSRTSAVFASIRKNWLAVAAAITAGVAGMKKSFDAFANFASFQSQRDSLTILAAKFGETADTITASMAKAASGLLSVREATDVAVKSLNLGLTARQLVELSEAAKTVADIRGIGVNEALQQLSEGIATLKMDMLESAVGIIDLNKEIGEQAKEFNRAQQAAALYEVVLGRVKKLQEEMADASAGLDTAIGQVQKAWENITLDLQRKTTRVLAGTAAAIDTLKASWLIFKAQKALFQTYPVLSKEEKATMFADARAAGDAAKQWWDLASMDFDAAAKLAAARKNWAGLIKDTEGADGIIEDAAKAQAELNKQLSLATNVMSSYRDAMSSLKDTLSQLQAAQISELTKKLKELSDFEAKVITQRATYADLQNRLAVATTAKGSAQSTVYADLQDDLRRRVLTDEERYQDDWIKLQKRLVAADKLFGQARIDALEEYQKARVGILEQAIAREGKGDKATIKGLIDKTSKDIALAETQKEIEKLSSFEAEMAGYYDMVFKLQAKLAASEALSGQARIDALEEYQKARVGILEQTIAREGGGDQDAIRRLVDEASKDIGLIETQKDWLRRDVQAQYEADVASLETTLERINTALRAAQGETTMLSAALGELTSLVDQGYEFAIDVDWSQIQAQTDWVKSVIAEVENTPMEIRADGSQALTEVERIREELRKLERTPIKIKIDYVELSDANVKTLDERLARLRASGRSSFAKGLK